MIPSPIKRVTKPFFNFIVSLRERRRKKERLLSLYSRFVSKGDLVFDIGAHEGEEVDIFLALGARVVAVEPQPQCVSLLRRKFDSNVDVIVVEAGVTDEVGRQTLYVNSLSSGISTFLSDWTFQKRFLGQRWDHKCTVSMTTLDSLIRKFGVPKFCKIDVEGLEWPVVKGLHEALQGTSFEFSRGFIDQTRCCVLHLESLGKIKFNYSLKEEHKLELLTWVKGKEVLDKIQALPDPDYWGDIYMRGY